MLFLYFVWRYMEQNQKKTMFFCFIFLQYSTYLGASLGRERRLGNERSHRFRSMIEYDMI